ncbi:MAG TPA: S9 family peptidase [Ktedonobacteraceae bacterium]|nr:S9 family peptidase [Ktedonobacteraceae bacterium]
MARSITIEDLYKFTFLSKSCISPDGRQVAYVVTRIDERKHVYRSAIWVTPTAGGEPRRLSAEPTNATGPTWSPDGRWLAFLSEREGKASRAASDEQKKLGKDKPQIWLLPTDGGEARQLTFLPHGASAPVWSPDGQWLAFTAAVGPLDEEGEDGKPLPKARVIDRLWYRLDGAGFIYEQRSHLFLLHVSGGEPVQLTDGDWDDDDPAWSPDGKRLAFVSSRAEDRWRTPTSDLYTLALNEGKAGELQLLTDGTQSCGAPSWSPDGLTIAFLGALKWRSGGHVDLYTIAADARQSAATCHTANFEGCFQDGTNSDADARGGQRTSPPIWSPDSQTIYALAAWRGATRVFALAAHDPSANPLPLTPGASHVRDFSIDASGERLAILMSNPTRPAEVFVGRTGGGDLQKLTSFNEELFSQLKLGTLEHMPYTGAEGWPMDGWILKPPDFDPAQKYPMILQIHGGPHTQYGYGFFHEMQVQAANGYVVFFTNPRGSIGYGRDFSLAVRGAWGAVDSLDIMAGVDTLIARGYIDEGRLGVTGGSYGGFMTNWLIGHYPDRFAAAVTDRSVNNMASDFGSCDFGWTFADDELEVTPWEDLECYRQRSPITFVKNMRTPLLIIHSEQDLRCNIEQAEQLFTALKYLGREVLFVRFEGQSHGLSRGGHPKLRLERLHHGLNWFKKHFA